MSVVSMQRLRPCSYPQIGSSIARKHGADDAVAYTITGWADWETRSFPEYGLLHHCLSRANTRLRNFKEHPLAIGNLGRLLGYFAAMLIR